MTALASTLGPSAYWYLARGTGAIALVLLSATVVIGILGQLRFALAPRWPRFAIDTLHRDISLLVLVVLVVHIVTSVLDGFAPIKLTDAVIPFASSYRPLWLGLGALAFDLLIALVLTSLLRRRIGYRTWRLIHWLAYASWPVAVLHGLGTGTDTKISWMLLLTALCVAVVTIATVVRIARTDVVEERFRAPTLAAAIVTPLAIAIFTLWGPLQHGWARRAGTPASLLPHRVSAAVATARPVATHQKPVKLPFTASLSGTANQTSAPGGVLIDLNLHLSGGARGTLRIRLAGTPLDGGGLSLTGSQVDLVTNNLPSVMDGKIVSLQGTQLIAHLSDAEGMSLSVHANLNINGGTGAVTGNARALPMEGAH